MKIARIVRSAVAPSGMDQTMPKHPQSTRTIDLQSSGGFVGRYTKARMYWLIQRGSGVRMREVYCWLFDSGEQAGALSIQEYAVEPFLSDGQFWEAMDGESSEANDLAELLIRHWEDVGYDLAPEGTFVLLDRLWVSPKHARSSQWVQIVQHLLEVEFHRRCILVLKAFPLEYEGRGHRNPNMRRRQRAMVRLYKRKLGVSAFPGKAGRDGWLYSIPPSARRYGVRKPKRNKRDEADVL